MNITQRITDNQFTLIAEIGVNYYDIAVKEGITPLEAAELMIREAAAAGVHAVKFQSYKAGTLASKNSPSYWDTTEESTTSQYELFQKFDSFGEAEYAHLARYCQEQGIEFMSTAFDYQSADYLYPLMNAYKISSSDLTNLPFIAYQAQKGKPIIISAGASKLEEIEQALATIRKYNDLPLVLMHCVLEYPTPYEHANLGRIAALAKQFPEVTVGYSDHCKPDANYDVVKTAYTLGAHIIEKHFTLDKTLPGNDHYHAMDAADAAAIVKQIEFLDTIQGTGQIDCSDTEDAARRNARRSIVATRDIKKGQVITAEDLCCKRPGTGLPPAQLESLLGKEAQEDIADDTIIMEGMIC